MTHPPTPPPGYQYQYGHGPYDHLYGPGPYDKQPAYGPPGVPPGGAAGDDTSWAVMCYVGTLAVGIIAPLIVYFAKRNTSAFTRFHAAQTLNYLITSLIQTLAPAVVAIPLAILTDSPAWLILLAPMVVFHVFAQWVVLIMGAVKAGKGEYWRIPTWLCFPMVR
ncbi:DUF4870 domain-containing protein [Thermomonospora amylolytica]|uniref:DUF4870 domain-containing protein n=1 Tax=Thermomonospora amylolytica TaxID=1411117 RepID=UPI001F458BC3|nr:DUF4870 domain-containing protein [Thermomonospora amylolytica]